MNCEICGEKLGAGKRSYCDSKCKERAKTLRRKDRREKKIERLLLEHGGVCEVCGYSVLGSLLFYHPTRNGSEIATRLFRAMTEETLKILNESKIVCRNCRKEK